MRLEFVRTSQLLRISSVTAGSSRQRIVLGRLGLPRPAFSSVSSVIHTEGKTSHSHINKLVRLTKGSLLKAKAIRFQASSSGPQRLATSARITDARPRKILSRRRDKSHQNHSLSNSVHNYERCQVGVGLATLSRRQPHGHSRPPPLPELLRVPTTLLSLHPSHRRKRLNRMRIATMLI